MKTPPHVTRAVSVRFGWQNHALELPAGLKVRPASNLPAGGAIGYWLHPVPASILATLTPARRAEFRGWSSTYGIGLSPSQVQPLAAFTLETHRAKLEAWDGKSQPPGFSPSEKRAFLRSLVGCRVEIPAHFDAWMAGARFGTVAGCYGTRRDFAREGIRVRLDHAGFRHCQRLSATDAEFLRVLPAVVPHPAVLSAVA